MDTVPTCGDCCWSMNCLELYAKRVYIISSCFLDQTIYLVWNMNILFGYLLSWYTKIENIDQIKITERRLLVSNMRNNSKRKYIFVEKSKPEGEKVSKLPTILVVFFFFFLVEKYWIVKHFNDNLPVIVEDELYIKIFSASTPPPSTPCKRDKQQCICMIQTHFFACQIFFL